MSDISRVYIKEPSIVARKIAGELVLVPIRQNTGDLQCIYNLNEVAARIWELIDAQRSLEDIVSVIVEEYEVDHAQASNDVEVLAVQLKEMGLITTSMTIPGGKLSS